MRPFAISALAEAAFYAAFEALDIAAMQVVWAPNDDIVCVHPMGPSLRGTQAVMESWREILSNGDRLRFTIHQLSAFGDQHTAVHHVYEQIAFGPSHAQSSVVIATNAYTKFDDGWRMVLHQGSPGRAHVRNHKETLLQY